MKRAPRVCEGLFVLPSARARYSGAPSRIQVSMRSRSACGNGVSVYSSHAEGMSMLGVVHSTGIASRPAVSGMSSAP